MVGMSPMDDWHPKGLKQPRYFYCNAGAAPIVLVVLTRLKMPVSTTLLLLTSFASEMSAVSKVIVKSLSGYALAFVLAFGLWFALQKIFAKWLEKPMHPAWVSFQWITTGILWSVWLQQDAANIAVYLPRSLSGWEFVGFAGTVVIGLGWIFKNGGDKIQEVVDEKNNVTDIRAATIIDLLYAIILFYFKSRQDSNEYHLGVLGFVGRA